MGNAGFAKNSFRNHLGSHKITRTLNGKTKSKRPQSAKRHDRIQGREAKLIKKKNCQPVCQKDEKDEKDERT